VGLPTDKLHREMSAHAANYDHLVIDAPPQAKGIARSIILAADLVLIPVQPSPHDIWSAQDIVKLIEEASSFKENLKTAFVVNCKIANTALGRDVFTALETYPFPVLQTAICRRVAFAESAALGASVLETEPNGPAAREIEALTREALEMMNHDQKNRTSNRHKKAR
jgi:chromosome partitioning protein